MRKIKTETLIEYFVSSLECSQRVLAKLLDVSEHTLSNNKDKLLGELTPNTKEKFLAFFDVLSPFVEKGLRSQAIFQILEAHVYEDYAGRHDSVISALRQNKYSIEVLKEIARIAEESYQKSQREKFQDVFLAVKTAHARTA